MGKFHRSPDEVKLVPSSPFMIQLTRAHCNLQHCDSARAAHYISEYISKAELYMLIS